MNDAGCQLYLIRHGDTDYYKVGISADVKQRLEQLQSCNPIELTVISTCYFNSMTKAKAAEALAHKSLADQRIHGEWFWLDRKQVRQLQHDMITCGE